MMTKDECVRNKITHTHTQTARTLTGKCIFSIRVRASFFTRNCNARPSVFNLILNNAYGCDVCVEANCHVTYAAGRHARPLLWRNGRSRRRHSNRALRSVLSARQLVRKGLSSHLQAVVRPLAVEKRRNRFNRNSSSDPGLSDCDDDDDDVLL